MQKIKEWYDIEHDVEATIKKVEKVFTDWYRRNLTITHGDGYNVEDIFGLPYTSSGSYAGIWNCQAEAYLKGTEYRFIGLALSEDLDVLAIFHKDRENDFEKEIENVIGVI